MTERSAVIERVHDMLARAEISAEPECGIIRELIARYQAREHDLKRTVNERDELWLAADEAKAEAEQARRERDEARILLKASENLTDRVQVERETYKAERDRLAGQVAATKSELERAACVRVLCGKCGRVYKRCRVCEMAAHLCDTPAGDELSHDPACILADTAAAALTHDQRVRAEALEEAAKEVTTLTQERDHARDLLATLRAACEMVRAQHGGGE